MGSVGTRKSSKPRTAENSGIGKGGRLFTPRRVDGDISGRFWEVCKRRGEGNSLGKSGRSKERLLSRKPCLWKKDPGLRQMEKEGGVFHL